MKEAMLKFAVHLLFLEVAQITQVLQRHLQPDQLNSFFRQLIPAFHLPFLHLHLQTEAHQLSVIWEQLCLLILLVVQRLHPQQQQQLQIKFLIVFLLMTLINVALVSQFAQKL